MNAPHTPSQPLLELDLLKTLIAIADTGNFSTAAELVLRTPSAVSMQVKKIEEIVGRPVFKRDSRSVSLTADGIMLLEHARRLIALNNEMVSQFVTPNVAGEIRIGAGDDFAERLLPSLLRDFNRTHPSVVVEVVMENTNELIAKVKAGEIDLAVIVCGAGYKNDHEAEVLATEPLVWAARKGGIAAEQDPLPISVWEEGCAWRNAALDALDSADRDYRIAFRSAYIGGQKAAVLSDLAVAPLPISSLSGDIVEACASKGMPKLAEYALGLLVREEPNDAVKVAADHLRASFAISKIDAD
ncbi:MAG: LysR substrate-binding domain-containing protein [Pseudomonadota bacterium]